MEIEFHRSTTCDLNQAIAYYEKQRKGLGEKFRVELNQSIQKIQFNPYIYRQIKGLRRASLKKFPYSIVYKIIDEQKVRILIIRHHRLSPDYGLNRR